MYLILQEVAESFGVSEGTVESWIRDENMPSVIDRDLRLFKRDDVVAWAEAHGLAATAGFLAKESPSAGFKLSALLRAGGIYRDVAAADVRATMAEIAARMPGVTGHISKLLATRIQSPEGVVWAPAGRGFALPNLSARVTLGRDAGLLALLLTSEPLELVDPPEDRVPVTKLLFFISPTPRGHLDLLARLTHLLHDTGFLAAVEQDGNDDDIHRTVAVADAADRAARKGTAAP